MIDLHLIEYGSKFNVDQVCVVHQHFLEVVSSHNSSYDQCIKVQEMYCDSVILDECDGLTLLSGKDYCW